VKVYEGDKADVECTYLCEQSFQSLDGLQNGPAIVTGDVWALSDLIPRGVARVIGRVGLEYNNPGFDLPLLLHLPVRWEYRVHKAAFHRQTQLS
jgi:hypothetical protein